MGILTKFSYFRLLHTTSKMQPGWISDPRLTGLVESERSRTVFSHWHVRQRLACSWSRYWIRICNYQKLHLVLYPCNLHVQRLGSNPHRAEITASSAGDRIKAAHNVTVIQFSVLKLYWAVSSYSDESRHRLGALNQSMVTENFSSMAGSAGLRGEALWGW